jgi:DNA repair ATPase RecN
MKKFSLPALILLSFLVPSFSYAAEASTTVSTTDDTAIVATTTITKPVVKPFTVCSQEAIEKRDTAIAASRSLYNIAMSNALTERKNREKAAIALDDPDEKKDAIQLSVDTYKHQAKVAQTTLTQARKAIWQTFDTDVNTCRDIEAASQADTTVNASSSIGADIRKMDAVEVKDVKSLKDTIIDSIKSLFN